MIYAVIDTNVWVSAFLTKNEDAATFKTFKYLADGLPGLIVKISDTKKEYTFELVKLEKTKRPIMTYDFSRFRKVSCEHMLKL